MSEIRKLNVLVACEESQAVASEFRSLGHNAFSCDLVRCSGGHPEYHIMCDCLSLLNGRCNFITEDGSYHSLPVHWDLIIAHPPCTYLTKAGAQLLFDRNHNIRDFERYKKGLLARDFFFKFFRSDCPYIAIENPTPMHIFDLPTCSQVIQPYYFGHPESKRTCLWLVNLPPLLGTLYCGDHRSIYQRCGNSKRRSKTYPGIARAMAVQWSSFIYQDLLRQNLL